MSSAPSSKHSGRQSDEASNDSTLSSDESSDEQSDSGYGLLEDTEYLEDIDTIYTFDVGENESIIQENDANNSWKNKSSIDHYGDLKDEQQIAVSTSKHSKQGAIDDYKESQKKKMELLERKRAELNHAPSMLAYLSSSSGAVLKETQQKQYMCYACKKTIKTECKCLSRSLRLYSCNHDELQKGLDLVINEVSEVRKVYSREKSMKVVKDKLRKKSRANEKISKQDDGNRICYNCKLPITATTEKCKCFVISRRIPFNIWADEKLIGPDLKQQLATLFENEPEGHKKSDMKGSR